MRRRWEHTAPPVTQPEPADNTTEHVEAQVRRWTATGVLVHPESALEIAAWWQSPGSDGIDFAVFASSGQITEDLADAIEREVTRELFVDVDHLRALDAYVRSCSVTPYVIGHNVAGYLPSDPRRTLDYTAAVQVYRDQLVEYRDGLPDCECSEVWHDTSEEMCEPCAETASVGSYLVDGGREWPGRTLCFTTDRLSEVLPTVYWLIVGEPMTYADFLADPEVCCA